MVEASASNSIPIPTRIIDSFPEIFPPFIQGVASILNAYEQAMKRFPLK
jgi:hypothetical protein